MQEGTGYADQVAERALLVIGPEGAAKLAVRRLPRNDLEDRKSRH